MFAYCRSNPVRRIDKSGTIDQDCYDTDSLDDEDLRKESAGGGNSSTPQTLSNTTATNQAGIEQRLKQCANTANAKVPGKGPVVGTQKHTVFAQEVNNLNNPNLVTERSYRNGEVVPYGTAGSVRFDVILYDTEGKPVAAWDFKTGSATLSASRIQQMQAKAGLDIPIHMIK